MPFIAYQNQPPEEIVHTVGCPRIAKIFWEEYVARQYREWEAAFQDQLKVSIANSKAQHRPHDCLGECVFRIAKRLRYKIAQCFGWEAATSNEFCKELIRDNKDRFLFVPVQEKRAMVIKTRDLGPRTIIANPTTATIVAKSSSS